MVMVVSMQFATLIFPFKSIEIIAIINLSNNLISSEHINKFKHTSVIWGALINLVIGIILHMREKVIFRKEETF